MRQIIVREAICVDYYAGLAIEVKREDVPDGLAEFSRNFVQTRTRLEPDISRTDICCIMANEMLNNDGTQPTRSIQSLDRGLTIVEAVARSSEPVSLGELTALLGIDRSSVFRLANTLKRRGFLAYPAGRKDYILGLSILRLSRQYDWGNMLIQVSHEALKMLASRTNETAHLAVREGRQALFIDYAGSSRVIAVSGQVGELVPLYCTAHGKALLADFDKPALTALFGSAPLRAHTSHSITNIDALAAVCAQVKASGYAVDDAEYTEGIRCVAAPIRTTDGLIIGSIGISAPTSRFSVDFYRTGGIQVMEIAEQIQAALNQFRSGGVNRTSQANLARSKRADRVSYKNRLDFSSLHGSI